MKVIFLKFKIIGTLSYDNIYNQLINKNLKSFWINKNIKMEFKKIIRVCCETTKFWIQSEKS